MYSAYKLNKEGDNTQPQGVVPACFSNPLGLGLGSGFGNLLLTPTPTKNPSVGPL